MPRQRRPQGDMLEDRNGQPIMPVIVTRHNGPGTRERKVDPYSALDGGAVPQEKPPARKRGTRRARAQEQSDLARAQAHARDRENRYDLYLDALIDTGGDRVEALALVYKITNREAADRYHELLADVQRGVSGSSITEVLERNDLSLAARVKVLRKHLYSPVAAASLKAADMIADIDNRPSHVGTTYEHYVRLVMAEE